MKFWAFPPKKVVSRFVTKHVSAFLEYFSSVKPLVHTKLIISRLPSFIFSEVLIVLSGVPQGTVLGPLMFLIYINDIAANLDNSTRIRLFADDCLLYRVIKSPHDHEVLQKDLTSLYEWSCKWQMSFNISKCKILRITTKRNPSVFNYSMVNEYLDHVSHHPYLGVEITHNLKWSLHINDVVAKANRVLWFIRRNLHRCSKTIKQQMYIALVRPHLEYAGAVWDTYVTLTFKTLKWCSAGQLGLW